MRLDEAKNIENVGEQKEIFIERNEFQEQFIGNILVENISLVFMQATNELPKNYESTGESLSEIIEEYNLWQIHINVRKYTNANTNTKVHKICKIRKTLLCKKYEIT